MKYLENNICEFKPLFNLNPKIKKNIISLSFFKMYNGGYKNFNLYIEGFKKLHKMILEDPLNYTIRIFIDETINSDKDLLNKLINLERVELVLYSSEKYKQKSDSKYHIGLFGTLIRFFPLFDFPNNDGKIIMIMDMDDIEHFTYNQKIIKNLGDSINSIHIIKSGSITKNVLYKLDMFSNEVVNPYVIAPKYIGFKSINHDVLYDFFNEIESNHKKIFSLYLDKLKYNKKMLLNNQPFIYGVDEYFLNLNLTNYLIKNKISFGVYFNWEIYGSLYNLLKIKDIEKKKYNLIDLMINYLLDKINIKYNKKDSIYLKYKIIDNILYSDKNKKKNTLIFYFYKLMIYFCNNPLYKFVFEKDLYLLIKKYNLFGSYEFIIISYYNTPNYNYKIIKKKEFKSNEKKDLLNFSKKYCNLFN